jgi:rhodanese-related sulfurtransferase
MLLLLALVACGSTAPTPTPPPVAPPVTAPPPTNAPAAAPPQAGNVRNVDVATLKADLDRMAVPLLIDVRTPAEYAAGHVPGARNVPIDTLDPHAADLGTGEVYVICESGGRSARASATLASAGHPAVNITGGTAAWRAAGLPVEVPK